MLGETGLAQLIVCAYHTDITRCVTPGSDSLSCSHSQTQVKRLPSPVFTTIQSLSIRSSLFFTHATLRVQNIFPIALDSLRFLFSFPNNLQPHLSYLSSQLPYASLLLFFSSPLPLPTSCTPPSFFLNLTDRIQKHICIQRNIRKRLNENFEGIIFFSANISHRKHLNNPQQ